MADKIIKQIDVGTISSPDLYDIAAKYIQDGTNVKSWQDILDLIEAGFDIVVVNSLPEPSDSTTWADIYETYHNKIVFVPKSQPSGTDQSDEYVIQRTGTDPNYSYAWEHIGSTDIDLTPYALWGIYASGTPSTNVTNEAGGATVNTSNDGKQTASGTATVTIDLPTAVESGGGGTAEGTATVSYQKSSNQTQSAGSTATANSGEAGGVTIDATNFTFTGTEGTAVAASFTAPVKIDHHSYTPQGSITGSAQVPKHSHSVNASTTTLASEITFTANGLPTRASFDYVSGVKTSGGTADAITGLTSSAATVITGITTTTGSAFNSATVDANGVLSFVGTTVVTGASASGSANALTSVSASGSATVILKTGLTTSSAYQITGVGTSATLTASTVAIMTGATISEQASVTIQGSSFGFSGNAAVLSHTQAATAATLYASLNVTVPTVNAIYTPSGTLGGTQVVAAHSHTYVSLPAHTHGITLTATSITGTVEVSVASHTHGLATTSTTITGTAAVAVSSHTHSVTIASHTHSLGNHTHNVEVSSTNRTPLPTPTV